MKYPKKYTVKEWKRFDWIIQEAVCKKYNVILTDYKEPLTKKGMALKICKVIYSQLNKKNFDKSIGLIQSGTNSISEIGKVFDNPKKEYSKNNNQNVRSAFWGNDKQKDSSNSIPLFGKKIDFW